MEKIHSGIKGLDELIDGGFSKGTINIVSGPPGSGKTLFGIHYILNAPENSNGVYITLEEPAESIIKAATELGIEKRENTKIVDFGKIRENMDLKEEMEYQPSSFESIKDFLQTTLEKFNIDRLVIDSVTALGIYYKKDEYRRELFAFSRFLRHTGITTLFLSENIEVLDQTENFVSDSITFLNYENIYGENRRTVTVYKMRFTKHDPYKHPFLILPDGLEIIPDEVIRE